MLKDCIPFVPRCPECQVFLPYEGAMHPEHHQCSLHLGSLPHDPVEWAIYREYAPYPLLYGRSPWSRWFIFDHLFFANGTGYEWVGGELRDRVSDAFHQEEMIPFRSLEEEEKEFLENIPPLRGRDTASRRELLEEAHQRALALIREDWAQFEKKPKKWYPLSEFSALFSLPEHVSLPWLLAACDATQMFLQGRSDGQSLRQIYKVIEHRAALFARLGLAVPPLEETRMTATLLREKNSD